MSGQQCSETLERLFHEGLELDTAGRKRLLAPFRDSDPTLCRTIESLWDNHRIDGLLPSEEHTSALLSEALSVEASTQDVPENFILEKLISAGPMGEVYKARQKQPSRQVALKILPKIAGTGTTAWRFENEREHLAKMQHPQIATILESGTWPDGRPYFVMEFFEGEAITAFCDSHSLPLKQRLELFAKVCAGVQHAHQKAVIHRDLKPDNILVLEVGGRPEPKIIDFGIAKFPTSPQDTRTAIDTVMGTRAYLSPEAASGNSAKVDIRSDIYALGILLCELLIGVVPDQDRMTEATMVDWCRIVSAREPPSLIRLLPDGERGKTIAKARSTSLWNLRNSVSKELSWIFQKATSLSADARYPSCDALALDLKHYLNHHPVSAGPPSHLYRIGKFLRRHKIPVLFSLVLFVVALTSFSIVTQAYSKTKRSEQRLLAVNQFNQAIFERAHPNRIGPLARAGDLLIDAETQVDKTYGSHPDLEIAVRLTLAQSFQGIGDSTRAQQQYRLAYEQASSLHGPFHQDTLTALEGVAFAKTFSKDLDGAKTDYRSGFERALEYFGPDNPQTLRFAAGLANVLGDLGERGPAKTLFEDTLARQARVLPASAQALLATRINFARFLIQAGDQKKAENLLRKNLTQANALTHPNHPLLLTSKHFLARTLANQGQREKAEASYRDLLAAKRNLLGAYHDDTLATFNDLVLVLSEMGRSDAALGILQPLFAQWPESKTMQSSVALTLKHNLGENHLKEGQLDQAETVLTKTLAEKLTFFGRDNRSTLITAWTLGECLQKRGDMVAAETQYRQVVDKSGMVLGEEALFTHLFRGLFGKFLMAHGSQEEGQAFIAASLPFLEAKNHPIAKTLAPKKP